MRRDYITIDAKPDWQTCYPPELVGEYLERLWDGFDYNKGEIIEMKPGMIIPVPEASLDGFLRWAYKRGKLSSGSNPKSSPTKGRL